jgi:hypothetical protein
MKKQKTPNFSTLLAYFFVFISVFLNGCQKDMTPMGIPLPQKSANTFKEPDITVSMARDNFQAKYGITNEVAPKASNSLVNVGDTVPGIPIGYDFSITPKWNEATIAAYLQSRSILVVPVEPILMFDMAGAEYALVYYRDSLQQTRSILQVYMSNDFKSEPNTSNFSGGMFQISMDGYLLNQLIVENGICQSKKQFRSIYGSGNQTEKVESPDPSKCPTWGGGSTGGGIGNGLANFWNAVVGFFSGFNGAPNSPIILDPNFGLPGADPVFSGGQAGSGGTTSNGNGGGNDLQDEIDNNLFGASRSRLLRVVNYLELTEVTQIRALIYDPILVSHFNSFINENNSATYGFGAYGSTKKSMLVAYLNVILPHLETLSNAQYPAIGSQQWYNAVSPLLVVQCVGAIRFVGFTPQELADNFRVIPEDGNNLITPTSSGVNYTGDGFFSRYHTNQQYWFKVSAGGLVVVTKNANVPEGFVWTPSIHDEKCQLAALTAFALHITNFQFWVGWDVQSTLSTGRVNPF